MNRKWRKAVLAAGAAAILSMAGTGVARAVSGGGYSPDQQDCPWNSSANNAPSDPAATPAGCHNVAINVESGGTTDGNPNSDNTRYVEFGNNQGPNMAGNPGFGFLEDIGDPGTPTSPHAGCLSANTGGTGGGTGTGCGDNPNGTGFSASYDYYQVYCPATAGLPLDSIPAVTIQDPTGGSLPDNVALPSVRNCSQGQPIGQTAVNPDTGGGYDALTKVAAEGVLLYLGMDDNTDNGEHDGWPTGNSATDGAINGTSDGGALTVSVSGTDKLKSLLVRLVDNPSSLSSPDGHNPEGIANASEGECADGICAEATTQQQTVFYGCGASNPQMNTTDDQCAQGTPQSQDVYQNQAPASTQEQGTCQSGDKTVPAACYTNANGSPNPGGPNTYRQETPSHMNAEPGVQTYQDPDPQRSPAAPFDTPGAYAGTCGVYFNDNSSTTGQGTGIDPGYIANTGFC